MKSVWKQALNKCRIESGQAMLEFAVVLPVLLITLMASLDVGRAMTNYLTLSQIAYEGARYAASLPGLEEGNFHTSAPPPQNSRQARVREMIFELVDQHNFDRQYFEVETLYQLAAIENDVPINHVEVTVTGKYNPLFAFPAIPVSVTATAPYLFPEGKNAE